MSYNLDPADLDQEAISERLTDRASDWRRAVREMHSLDHHDPSTDGRFTHLAGERRRLAESLGDWIVTALAHGWDLDDIADITQLDEDTLTRFPGVTEELAA